MIETAPRGRPGMEKCKGCGKWGYYSHFTGCCMSCRQEFKKKQGITTPHKGKSTRARRGINTAMYDIGGIA